MITLPTEINLEEASRSTGFKKPFEVANKEHKSYKIKGSGIEFWILIEFNNTNFYYVSSKGRVYNSNTKRLVGNVKVYPRVTINKKTVDIHRLVAENFIPNPENKEQVNHIDGDKTNNHISNLEWATPKENIQHAVTIGLLKGRKGTLASEEEIKEMIKLRTEGNSYQNISKIMNKYTGETIRRLINDHVDSYKELDFLTKSIMYVSDDKIQRMIKLRESKKSCKEIGEILGVSGETVRKHTVKKYKL